ncbi:conserved hypothetical protein [Xenorhabdus nematophila F1]|uniref:terminase large subunit domain-containing protein n=1 Tax=Xenorhabdus nematophila TaxID=628 RepID=UPI00032752E1|nr:terminase family protein [Xenorhabdus nematophila]CCW29797.1 conserved hypothetical protein [Xenorhabdus nematophila F1]
MRIDLGIDLDIEIVNHIHRKFVLDLLGWQERWKANQHHRNRFLHKCRQVGADHYFMLEALSDACRTGRNKIFMSDKEYLPNFVHNVAQYFPQQQKRLIEQADEIKSLRLSNGAKICFFHENSYVAGHYGDVYVSEWAYSDDPISLIHLALGLSQHEQWHRTFFSSRDSGDNGEAAYKMFFTKNRIQCEPAFFDTVTLFDDVENRMDKERIAGRLPQQVFEELYLCRLPHPRW